MTLFPPISSFPHPFGDYEILERLGGGAMGNVYRAKHTRLEHLVALKIPHPAIVQDSVGCELFLSEARAMAGCQHAQLCGVYEYNTVDDIPYLAMVLVEGPNLEGHLQARGRLEIADAVWLAHSLALVLAEMHSQGVLHRDVKPSNIIWKLTDHGSLPVLVDFGLALRLDHPASLSLWAGRFAGTPEYMPLEQLERVEHPSGSAWDIYSLGVVLYQLLTGQLPFPAADKDDLIEKIKSAPPPKPSTLRPGISPELDNVCLTAVARRPRDRFDRDMTQLANALANVLASLYFHPQPAPPDPNPGRPLVRQRDVRLAFVGYGDAAPPVLRDRLYLDVGNELRVGVIDHHQLKGATSSTTRLVLNCPELLEDCVAPYHRPGDTFTLVLHEFPDLDSVAAAFLATEYLSKLSQETDRFPKGTERLVHYVDRIDAGWPGMNRANPFSLYAAYHRLANRPVDASVTQEEHWQAAVEAGMFVIRYVLQEMVRSEQPLEQIDAFACPGQFTDADRRAVLDDVHRYERKMTDPSCMPQVVRLHLPDLLGVKKEVEALLVRDVQNEDDRERVLFFKDWARTDTDAKRCSNGKGFDVLCVFMSEGASQVRSCILSTTPESQLTLKGLGDHLDREEGRRRALIHGRDDRVYDPATGRKKKNRAGYSNSDPWYDGRAHGYTIVDAPREGTVLTADEIEALFLEYGECTTPARNLAQ